MQYLVYPLELENHHRPVSRTVHLILQHQWLNIHGGTLLLLDT